jgi:valyl-tRNA synthetase
VCIAAWPTFPAEWRNQATEASIGGMQDLIGGIREVRNRYMVDPKTELTVSVRCAAAVAAEFRSLEPFIQQLAGVGALTVGPDAAKPPQSGAIHRSDFEAYVSLTGLIDPAKEAEKLQKQRAEKTKALVATKAKLANASFVERAPAEVVQQQRELVADLEQQIKAIEANLKELS